MLVHKQSPNIIISRKIEASTYQFTYVILSQRCTGSLRKYGTVNSNLSPLPQRLIKDIADFTRIILLT